MKLSIITATWNSSETIADTLASLAQQTYTEFEYIVIDGGSTDDTVAKIKASGLRVDHLVSEPDRGIYDALNKGIALATGDYVGFLHSDDLLATEQSLANLAKALTDTQSDAIYADLQYVQKGDTNKVIRHWRSGAFDRKKMKYGWMPPHPTFYMRRSLYEQLGGFDLSYRIAADYDSLLRYLWASEVQATYLPEVLIKMRVGGASNRSLANIVKKSAEDISAMNKNGVPAISAFPGKNLSKIPQFF